VDAAQQHVAGAAVEAQQVEDLGDGGHRRRPKKTSEKWVKIYLLTLQRKEFGQKKNCSNGSLNDVFSFFGGDYYKIKHGKIMENYIGITEQLFIGKLDSWIRSF